MRHEWALVAQRADCVREVNSVLRMSAPRWALILSLPLIAMIGAGVIWWPRDETPQDGPLVAPSSIGLSFPVPPGAAATWGVIFPYNPTDGDLTVLDVAPVGTSGLDVLGVVAVDAGEGTIVNAIGFPPPGLRTRPVQGATLPPAARGVSDFEVLVGFRLRDDSSVGSIDAIRVEYATASGERYEVMLPWTLEVTASP